MKITQVEWIPITKAVVKEYKKDDVPGLAAEMAYWIIFSIFPFFIFLAAIAGIIGQAIGIDDILSNITDNLYSALDASTAETLKGILTTILTPESGALSIGAIVSAALALNSASTAISTMMKAFNRAYGVEETRNFIVAKLVAIGLTLVLVLMLIGGSLLLTFGGRLADLFDLGAVGTVLLNIGRVIGAFVGISLGLAILYWKGPNIRQTFAWISPGSVLSTVGLAIFSVIFGYFVQFFAQASFNKTYGALAGAIIFLFFLRIASTIILLGAEFNAEAARRYDPETIRDKITDPRKQLPGKQPLPHPQAAREAGVTQRQVAATNGRAAQKLAAGHGGPETANAPIAATVVNGGEGFSYGLEPVEELTLDQRLRAIRERPFVSAVERVHLEVGHISPQEQERRVKTALATFGVAAVMAVGSLVSGVVRRNAA